MVNWGEVESQTFDPLPADAVRAPLDATFTNFERRASGSSDYDYFNLEYTLAGEAAEAHGNRKFWETCSLNPKALFALKNVLLAHGIEESRVSAGSDELPEDLLAETLGCDVRLKITPPKSYPKNDGGTGMRNDVQKVLAPAYAANA